MGESPTLGKCGGKFWKEGGNEEKGRKKEEREGREKRKCKREARKKGKMET